MKAEMAGKGCANPQHCFRDEEERQQNNKAKKAHTVGDH